MTLFERYPLPWSIRDKRAVSPVWGYLTVYEVSDAKADYVFSTEREQTALDMIALASGQMPAPPKKED